MARPRLDRSSRAKNSSNTTMIPMTYSSVYGLNEMLRKPCAPPTYSQLSAITEMISEKPSVSSSR